MPIFEFCCEDCEREFEELVLGSSEEIRCPDCGGPQVRKLFSIFGMKSGGDLRSSKGGDGCGSCTSHQCSTCH